MSMKPYILFYERDSEVYIIVFLDNTYSTCTFVSCVQYRPCRKVTLLTQSTRFSDTVQIRSTIAIEQERLLLQSMLAVMETCVPPSQSQQIMRLMEDLKQTKLKEYSCKTSLIQVPSFDRTSSQEKGG